MTFFILSFAPQIVTPAPPACFWTDYVRCLESCGDELIKPAEQVFVAGQPALEYRPYSKTCPTPPPVAPPQRWVTKTLCGTVTVYAYDVYLAGQFGKTARVTETRYVVAGLPATSTFTGPPPQDWSGIATPLPLPVISTQSYCTTVTVYE